MPDQHPLRRPSDDLGQLQEQLLRELDGISRHGDSWGEPSLFRAYLQHAQALAWQRVADGDLNAPRDILDHLLSAQPFVDRHAPRPPGLAAQAAQEVHQAIRSLYVADQALEEARTRTRLADRDRSRTEREILRILFENRGTYLRRGAVRSRMDPADRPTPARVGQILVELHSEGLVLRTHGRAQGSPSAAFYALSPLGLECCKSLWPELADSQEKEEYEVQHESVQSSAIAENTHSRLIEQAVSLVVDPEVPWEWRSILAGALGNIHPTRTLSIQLSRWMAQFPDDPAIATLIQIINSNWKYHAVLTSLSNEPKSDDEAEERLQDILATLRERTSERRTPSGPRSAT